MSHLEIKGLSSAYGKTEVLKDVSLAVDKGEVVSLIGPSGSGKSTLLRVLIGLTRPTAGEVWLDGERVRYRDRRSVREMRDRMAQLPASDLGMQLSATAPVQKDDPIAEAVNALIALGYKPPDASKRVAALEVEGLAVEEIVRLALQASLK